MIYGKKLPYPCGKYFFITLARLFPLARQYGGVYPSAPLVKSQSLQVIAFPRHVLANKKGTGGKRGTKGQVETTKNSSIDRETFSSGHGQVPGPTSFWGSPVRPELYVGQGYIAMSRISRNVITSSTMRFISSHKSEAQKRLPANRQALVFVHSLRVGLFKILTA